MIEHAVMNNLVDQTKDTVLWINNQEVWPLSNHYPWKKIVYDITDDWTQGFEPGCTRDQIIADDQNLTKLADEIVVCSQRLLELKRSDTYSVTLVANGVDCKTYQRVGKAGVPEAATTWRHPVLAYTGTLHRARLDLELLESVASKWPGTVALVGPDHLGKSSVALDCLENVVRTGPVPHSELPSWMSAMDVMIVPHRIDAFTESLNPLKLWEYLASGLPIVSTPVAGFRDFSEHLLLAEDADAFTRACHEALDEDPKRGQARQMIAREHSWSNRVDQIEKILKKHHVAGA